MNKYLKDLTTPQLKQRIQTLEKKLDCVSGSELNNQDKERMYIHTKKNLLECYIEYRGRFSSFLGKEENKYGSK